MLYIDIGQWEHTVRGAQYDKAIWCWRKLSIVTVSGNKLRTVDQSKTTHSFIRAIQELQELLALLVPLMIFRSLMNFHFDL